jgi:isoleucyl-tRNA synthetase
MIEAEEAFERMGADVMRWQFAAQPPDRNLLFGYGPAHEAKRKLLTFWHSAKFLVDYGNIDSFTPRFSDLESGPDDGLRPLDRWVIARTNELVADATGALEAQLSYRLIAAFEEFVDDLSNWYIRRSRRRFWDGDEVALRTLWYAIVQSLRVVSPVMPFLADHLWRNLAGPAERAPASIHLMPWPEPGDVDETLLAEVAAVRRVVELGRQARSTSGIKLRQPLRRLIVQGVELRDGHVDEIADELRVKEVVFGEVEATELRVKPNLPRLGPKLGKELGAVRAALQAGEFEELGDGRFRAAGHELEPDEVLVERRGLEGWAVAADDGLTVALDTAVDPELELEGRVFDLIHKLNSMRKEAGLELTDRINVTLPRELAELVEQHRDWIAREVLAVGIEVGDVDEPELTKA